MGIYGFLSAAYQETASKSGNIDAQITLIETKRDNIKEQLIVYNEEKSIDAKRYQIWLFLQYLRDNLIIKNNDIPWN